MNAGPLALDAPAATTDVSGEPPAISIRLVSGEPTRTEARLELSLPEASAGQRLEAAVFDLAGRRVRTLQLDAKRALSWDLRDDAGAPVRSGVYFVNVRVAGRSLTRRISVMR